MRTIRLLAVFGALAGMLMAIPASGAPAESLLKRHLEALGGEGAIRSVSSEASSAAIEILGTGLTGTIRSESARPCLSHSDISLGFFRIREGYDGERIWMVDPNGKLQVRRDEASLRYQRTMCLLESQEYLFGGPGFSIAAAGKDTVNGVPCEVLALDVDGGTPCRIFLSDSTFLVERLEITGPEGKAIQTFGDYRRVGGVMFPFLTKTEMPALGQRIEIRYETIMVNPPIDPVDFLPPAADAKDFRFAGGASEEGVPFEYRHRHLFVPVRLGGAADTKLFLVDSGAGMTVVDSTIAAGMKLPFGERIPGLGAGGAASFSMIKVPGLAVDGVEFSEQTAAAYPIAGLLEPSEEVRIGGILGYDFLSRFTTTIDYAARRVSFFDPDSFAANGRETVIEAPLRHNIFSLPVTIDGGESGTFLLDTGANGSVIQGSFAAKHALTEGRRMLEIGLRGAGGEERAALARFDSLAIGGVKITAPVLAIVSSTKGLGALETVDGVIGNDVLERFTVTLDYKRQRVLLEPNAGVSEPFFRDRAGVQLIRAGKGKIVVEAVIPGSPADEAGLAAGDIVLSVAGRKASKFSNLEEISKLFEAPEGTTYPIDVKREGKKRSVSLTLRQYL